MNPQFYLGTIMVEGGGEGHFLQSHFLGPQKLMFKGEINLFPKRKIFTVLWGT